MGEFVLATDPWLLPRNPVGRPASVHGSLPKSPSIPRDLIGHGNRASLGCGSGCACADCGGMGAFDLAAVENLIPGESFGIKNTYLVGGAIAAFLILPMLLGGGRRRKR